MLSRRDLLQRGGLWLAGVSLGRLAWSAEEAEVVAVFMRSDPTGSRVFFDPIGLLVRPGQRVRWVNEGGNVHTATAYHPDNARHPLRIPAGAVPWDSGYLVNPGESFEVRLTIEGVYDYFCTPHEQAGMVGRIVVAGSAAGSNPDFEPYPDESGHPEWRRIPQAALENFPPVDAILNQRKISRPV